MGLASCCWVLEYQQRAEVRQRYNISGSSLADFGATWALQVCCGGTSVCAQVQVSLILFSRFRLQERI